MAIKFRFLEQKKLTLRERRAVRRAIQEKLLKRAERRTGLEPVVIEIGSVGECEVRMKDGSKHRLTGEEAKAWHEIRQWEQTGEGQTPRLPV